MYDSWRCLYIWWWELIVISAGIETDALWQSYHVYILQCSHIMKLFQLTWIMRNITLHVICALSASFLFPYYIIVWNFYVPIIKMELCYSLFIIPNYVPLIVFMIIDADKALQHSILCTYHFSPTVSYKYSQFLTLIINAIKYNNGILS